MLLRRNRVWFPCAMPILAALACVLLAPQQGEAIPAFARKFGVKCYACHTIPPALNKNGYMFKRLGYRMPPDEMDGTKPAPKISELDKNIKFSITNSLATILQGSFTADKNVADNPGSTPTKTSSTSFNLDEAALFAAGAVPETNFSYFVHYELYQGGDNFLEQGFAVYTGGRANSSYFAKAGELHMQEGEGTRAAMFYNLFPTPRWCSPTSIRSTSRSINIQSAWTSAIRGPRTISSMSSPCRQKSQTAERGRQRDSV